jgi:hypothetical protein
VNPETGFASATLMGIESEMHFAGEPAKHHFPA